MFARLGVEGRRAQHVTAPAVEILPVAHATCPRLVLKTVPWWYKAPCNTLLQSCSARIPRGFSPAHAPQESDAAGALPPDAAGRPRLSAGKALVLAFAKLHVEARSDPHRQSPLSALQRLPAAGPRAWKIHFSERPPSMQAG